MSQLQAAMITVILSGCLGSLFSIAVAVWKIAEKLK